MNRIKEHPEGVAQDIIDAYSSLDAATVYEANGQRGAMDHAKTPIAWGQRMCGSALPVQCHPADNLMLHAAIALAQPGDVIIADVGPLRDAGYWGEITTVAAMARGVVGLVISGSIRDRAAIVKRGFPVWSGAVCMRGTAKCTPGSINYPVVVGGITVHAGDLVLADDDGVVVVNQTDLVDVLAKARERESKETKMMEQLEAGALTLDLLGFRAALETLGIHI